MESLPEWVEWCFVVASQWTQSLGFCCLTFPSVEQMCCPRDWLLPWGSEGGVSRRGYKNTCKGNDRVPAPSLECNWILKKDWTFFFFKKHTFSPLISQCSRRPAVKILAWFPSPAALRWATRARREFWNASLDLLSPAATQSTRSWKTMTTSEPQVGAVPSG